MYLLRDPAVWVLFYSGEQEAAIAPGQEPLEDTSAMAGRAVSSTEGLKGQSSVPSTPPEDRRWSLSLHLMGLLSSCFRAGCTAVTSVSVLKTGVPHLPFLLNYLAKQYCQIQMKRCTITVQSGFLYFQHCLEQLLV